MVLNRHIDMLPMCFVLATLVSVSTVAAVGNGSGSSGAAAGERGPPVPASGHDPFQCDPERLHYEENRIIHEIRTLVASWHGEYAEFCGYGHTFAIDCSRLVQRIDSFLRFAWRQDYQSQTNQAQAIFWSTCFCDTRISLYTAERRSLPWQILKATTQLLKSTAQARKHRC